MFRKQPRNVFAVCFADSQIGYLLQWNGFFHTDEHSLVHFQIGPGQVTFHPGQVAPGEVRAEWEPDHPSDGETRLALINFLETLGIRLCCQWSGVLLIVVNVLYKRWS